MIAFADSTWIDTPYLIYCGVSVFVEIVVTGPGNAFKYHNFHFKTLQKCKDLYAPHLPTTNSLISFQKKSGPCSCVIVMANRLCIPWCNM